MRWPRALRKRRLLLPTTPRRRRHSKNSDDAGSSRDAAQAARGLYDEVAVTKVQASAAVAGNHGFGDLPSSPGCARRILLKALARPRSGSRPREGPPALLTSPFPAADGGASI